MADQQQATDHQSSKFRSDFEHLQGDFNKLRGDMCDLVSSLVGVGKTGAGTARERIDAGLEELKKSVHTAKEKGEHVFEGAQKKIQERPFTSILIALGVGLLIGKLMDRRGD